MAVRRPARRTRPAPPSELLSAAARSALAAARRARATETSDVPELTETGWQLIHLTGSLAELTAVMADQAGRLDQQGPLRDTTGGDARLAQAHACRELSDLRRALDHAETAARAYYAAISHLSPVLDGDPPNLVDDDRGAASPPPRDDRTAGASPPRRLTRGKR